MNYDDIERELKFKRRLIGMKKKRNLSELMFFAGKHRYLTYASWLLSVISAILALVPFVYLFLIVKEVIEVAPDFSAAKGIVFHGWMAVGFDVFASFGVPDCREYAEGDDEENR